MSDTLRDRFRRALATADGFDFDSLEPHDYQRHATAVLDVLRTVSSEPVDLAETREALLSVGASDMPVSSEEVLEAMGAFERAVRQNQSLLESTQARGLTEVIQGLNAKIAGLEKDAARLRALENHGVDNWDGYSDAVSGLRDE